MRSSSAVVHAISDAVFELIVPPVTATPERSSPALSGAVSVSFILAPARGVSSITEV